MLLFSRQIFSFFIQASQCVNSFLIFSNEVIFITRKIIDRLEGQFFVKKNLIRNAFTSLNCALHEIKFLKREIEHCSVINFKLSDINEVTNNVITQKE